MVLGETAGLNISVFDLEGKPFILPDISNVTDAKTYAVFTVRAGNTDDIVLQLCMNLQDAVTYGQYTDNAPKGYNKFTSQDIDTTSSLVKYFADTHPEHKKRVVQLTSDGLFYCYGETLAQTGFIVVYNFEISFAILPEYTKNLSAKEYVYDINLYIGEDKEEYEPDEFPLKTILWKRTVVTPHKFILEDTNNA